MRTVVSLLITAAVLSAQQSTPEPTPEELRFVERLAALSGNERVRLIEAEKPTITMTLLRAFLREGNKLFVKDQIDDAAVWWELALHYGDRYGIETAQAAAVGNLGRVYDRRGEYEKAIEFYHKSVDIARKIGMRDVVANGLNALSISERKLGNFDEAIAAALESLSVAETLPDRNFEGQARNSLAVVWGSQCNYRSALEQYLRFLQIAQETGSRENEATALQNIGYIYSMQGNPELGITYYERSLRIKEQLGNASSISQMLQNLAEDSIWLGDKRRAAEYAERALKLAQAANNKLLIAQGLGTLAHLDSIEGRSGKAIERAEHGIELLDSTGSREHLPAYLGMLGKYHVDAGQFEAGLTALDRAITMSRELGDRNDLYFAASTAGEAYRKRGRLAEARPYLMEAIATAESLSTDVAGGAEAEQRYLSEVLDPYRGMILISAQGGLMDEAFRFAERARTRTLLEVLRQGRVMINKAMTADEMRQENRLRTQLAALNLRLAQIRMANGDNRSQIRSIEGQLQRVRLEQTDFGTGLYAKHPELKRQRLEVQPPTPAEIAASLPDRQTALLEYVVTGDQTLLFVVAKGSSRAPLMHIPITAKALEAKVDALAKMIAGKSLDYRAAAGELDKLLIEPARALLAGRTAVVIVPDGPLWRLPFQILESETGQTLLERFTVSYAPSATVLRELMARRKAGPIRTVLALGNPAGARLPEAESEVNGLREIYGPANAQVLTGDAATEAAFKSQAGRYDVLHLATHGVIEDRNPLYSYVALAKSGSEDGFLEAREMLNLDLKAQLVVLSACETARGKSGGGEGLIGMTWALFLAGSPATVASGWQVDSAATAQLMLEMHRGLHQGIGKAAALRSAALSLKNDARYRHPFYWAAFSLSGNAW